MRITPSTILLLLGVLLTSACTKALKDISTPSIDSEIKQKAAAAKENTAPSFMIRAGDTFTQAFRHMGMLDGKVYILSGDTTLPLPGNSVAIFKRADLESYLSAYGFQATFKEQADSPYVRVRIDRAPGQAKVRAGHKCNVRLSGVIPFGPVIAEICKSANIECHYADAGATAYAGVLYPVAYTGNCAGALDYLAHKADLALSFGDDEVTLRMMDTATIDLGVPLRDRRVVLDILADGRLSGSTTGNTSGTGTTTGTSTSNTNSSMPGSTAGTGNKGTQSKYETAYFQSIRNVLDSMRTSWGTWHYIPETGQIFVRDRAEAVAAIKSTLNRMAHAFQGRFDVTISTYRMTVSKDREMSVSLSRLINDRLSASLGNTAGPVTNPIAVLKYDAPSRTNLAQLLSDWGAIETVDRFDLTLQNGIPQTIKVANNIEYVRNVSTTIGTTTSTTTSSVEQANATDGSFITVQARQAESGKIAVDFGTFINRLDGFDTTQTTTSTVKSQKGFERTFDTMALVDEGIPYVAAVVSGQSRNDRQQSLPGLEDSGLVGLLAGGYRKDASSHTYIIVIVEARRH